VSYGTAVMAAAQRSALSRHLKEAAFWIE